MDARGRQHSGRGTPTPTPAPDADEGISGPERLWRLLHCYRKRLRAAHKRGRQEKERLQQEKERLQQENERLRERITELEREVRRLKGEVELGHEERFGRKTERGSRTPQKDEEENAKPKEGRRRRGQQPGSKGHGRVRAEGLPAEEVICEIPEVERCCRQCGMSWEEFPGTEDSEQIEVDVRFYRRVYRRKKYRPVCRCGRTPGIVTAPRPAKLIPKGSLGVSLLTTILFDKYELQRPTHRLLQEFLAHGLDLSQGTVTGALKRLPPLFEPVYEELRGEMLRADHWHLDETGWLMLAEGRRRWFLWVFQSETAVIYRLDPTRSSAVPTAELEGARGVVSVDRYVGYQPLEADGKIRRSFCWAHVRRDFKKVTKAKVYEEDRAWAEAWLERIGELYRVHGKREEALRGGDAERIEKAQAALVAYVAELKRTWKAELAEEPGAPRAQPLKSMERHWSGLTLFLSHPDLPLDNNAAERALRTPVVGRKNYYGSGSEWSASLAAMMFSIFATLRAWELNPRQWLLEYLEACRAAGGRAPPDLASFLPWRMDAERLVELSMPRRERHEAAA